MRNQSFTTILPFRFFTGLFIGYFVVAKVLIVEGLKIQYRHSFLAAIWCCFALGEFIVLTKVDKDQVMVNKLYHSD